MTVINTILDDFYINLARGKVNNFGSERKFGHAETVGTVIADVWDVSTTYPFIATGSATAMTLSSTASADAIGATGASLVKIFGLDENYNEITETVSMSGRTPITTVNTYFRVNRMIVTSAGTTGENQGNIALGTGAVTSGAPALIYSQITHTAAGGGENQTLQAIYTVPSSKTAYLVDCSFTTPQNKASECWLKVRPVGEVFQTKLRTMVNQNNYKIPKKIPVKIDEKSDVKLSAATDSGTTDIAGSFELVIVNTRD
jgi:hypothetical protein